jgi:hypothetical protein
MLYNHHIISTSLTSNKSYLSPIPDMAPTMPILSSQPMGPLTPPSSDSLNITIDDFADLLFDFYQLLIDMAYLPPNCILKPPHYQVAPRLTKREMKYHSLDPRIALLIQKIPYIHINVAKNHDIVPDTKVVVYGRYQALEESRDPLNVKKGSMAKEEYLESWVAPVWVQDKLGGVGTNLLYDTRTGTYESPGK